MLREWEGTRVVRWEWPRLGAVGGRLELISLLGLSTMQASAGEVRTSTFNGCLCVSRSFPILS